MSQLTKGLIAFHRLHRTPLEVGQGGFPIVAHGEGETATHRGVLEDL